MGVWVLFMTVAAMFEVGISGLIQNGLVRYLSKATGRDYGKIILSSLILHLVVTLVAAAAILGFSELLAKLMTAKEFLNTRFETDLSNLFQLFAVLLFALVPFSFFNFLQQANLNFRGIFWSNFVRKGLFFFAVFIFTLAGYVPELRYLLMIQIAAVLLAGVTGFLFASRYIRISEFKLDWAWVKRLFDYGIFTFGTNLSAMLYKSIDKFMLGRYIDTVAVALYDAAIKITNLVDVPTFSVASVVFPQSAIQAGEDPNAVKSLYEKSVGVTLSIILPFVAVVALIPDIVLWVVAGEKYVEAAPILRLTVLYGLFLPFSIQFGTILDSIGKPKINFVFTVIGMVLNISLNYLFIVTFDMGIYGAAYGTLLTYSLTFFMFQAVLYRMFKVNALNAFTHIPGFYRQGWEMVKKRIFKR